MRREQLTEKILDIKRAKGWRWRHITNEIGGVSPILIVGALLGQMKLVTPLAKKAAALFGLSEAEERMLNEVPMRGTPMPPTDPLIYRFYELVMVNGPAWKALIEEEFGDGIMLAIDFDMEIERQPDAKGDRVRISLTPSRAFLRPVLRKTEAPGLQGPRQRNSPRVLTVYSGERREREPLCFFSSVQTSLSPRVACLCCSAWRQLLRWLLR